MSGRHVLDHERLANGSGQTVVCSAPHDIDSIAASLLRPAIGDERDLDRRTQLGFVTTTPRPIHCSSCCLGIRVTPIYPSRLCRRWTNAQYPELSISAENGISFAGSYNRPGNQEGGGQVEGHNML